MKRTKINAILSDDKHDYQACVKGWVRTFRNNQFIALNDGSTIHNLQIVVDFENTPEEILKRITTGACISAIGNVIPSLGKGQKYELKVTEVEILGDSDAEQYPLQPKKHSLEFLREIAHLRFRTSTFSAVFRVRNVLAFAVHKFFQEKGFAWIHTPIITASDAEGAGQMFRVTTLDLKNPPKTENGEIDFSQDFFGKSTNLTVSGQLEGELAAMALSDVYTFGPTFRAENSNTGRHLAEFWMIEPEVAFNDLDDNMQLAEDMLQYVIKEALTKCVDDIAFLNDRLLEEEKQKPQQERSEMSLLDKLKFCVENNFERVTYTQAFEILRESNHNKKKKFSYLIDKWGADLQSEHERYLVEKHFKKPVILTDYPKDIKAFYMRQNDDDKTVRAMDVLFPGIGEIIGGSQREERLEQLGQRRDERGGPKKQVLWAP